MKDGYGKEVHNEVVRTIMEIVEHNANVGYVTLELWNFEEKRNATMEEATNVMLKIWKDVMAMKNEPKRLDCEQLKIQLK